MTRGHQDGPSTTAAHGWSPAQTLTVRSWCLGTPLHRVLTEEPWEKESTILPGIRPSLAYVLPSLKMATLSRTWVPCFSPYGITLMS